MERDDGAGENQPASDCAAPTFTHGFSGVFGADRRRTHVATSAVLASSRFPTPKPRLVYTPGTVGVRRPVPPPSDGLAPGGYLSWRQVSGLG